MRSMFYVLLVFFLAGCNSIYVKPNTLDTQAMIYAPRGGYSMQRSIKQVMEERGYKVHSGQLKSVIERDSSDKEIYSKSFYHDTLNKTDCLSPKHGKLFLRRCLPDISCSHAALFIQIVEKQTFESHKTAL